MNDVCVVRSTTCTPMSRLRRGVALVNGVFKIFVQTDSYCSLAERWNTAQFRSVCAPQREGAALP